LRSRVIRNTAATALGTKATDASGTSQAERAAAIAQRAARPDRQVFPTHHIPPP
jgi:hypothetical protein|tara:strand:- start:1243 stop:1404 length:162 start_codon:yes stop_codon:yes gene_type:complete